MANPVTRKEQFLHAIAQGDATLLPTPITREERFLRALSTGEEITPITHEERFLQAAQAFNAVNSNLFNGIYEHGYYLNGDEADDNLHYIVGGTIVTLVPVVAGSYYKVTKLDSSNRFGTMFTNRAPAFNATTESKFGHLRTIHDPTLMELTLFAPALATHLVIYVSNAGETPALMITKL